MRSEYDSQNNGRLAIFQEKKAIESSLGAKGCPQKFGVKNGETFSPLCRYETIRLVYLHVYGCVYQLS